MSQVVLVDDLEDDELYHLIFELLCSRRVDDAVELAQSSGMHRLAMLICQIGSDDEMRDLIMSQLHLWESQRADSTISPALLAIYRILGGIINECPIGPDELALRDGKSILSGLEWTNVLGVIFWYCNDCIGKLSEAVTMYDHYMDRLLPTPPFAPPMDGEGLPVDLPRQYDRTVLPDTSVLYSLLKAFFPDKDASIDNSVDALCDLSVLAFSKTCLRPRGYTKDFLDYRGSYVSLLLLECTGKLSTENSPNQIAIVRQHMISQLLSVGMWQWAVFVCLQIEDAVVRAYAVRDIVLRFGGKPNWESDQDTSEYFLMSRFSISDSLLNEATAYKCAYDRNFSSQAAYLIKCGQFMNATSIVCRQLVPRALFNSADSNHRIRDLLGALEGAMNQGTLATSIVTAWESTGGSLLSYFLLKSEVELLASGKGFVGEDLSGTGMDIAETTNLSSEEVLRVSERIVRVANELLHTLSRSNFGMCKSLSLADTVTKIAVHDIGTFLFKVITDLSKTDFNLAHQYLTQPELSGMPVLDSCRLQVLRHFSGVLGDNDTN